MVVYLLDNTKSKDKTKLAFYKYSEAGFISGFLTRVIIQPLDVLKIRFQLQEEPLRGKLSGKYKGIFQSVSLIYKEEGLLAFWKGHVPAQGLSGTYGIIQFTTYELLLQFVKNSNSIVNNYAKSTDFVCGALAGSLAITAAMPFDVIRTRLIAQGKTKIYTGSIDATKQIWKVEGIRGYFGGLVPSLAQIAPYTEASGILICGALSGTLAKIIVYPLDLVRHRLQINPQIRIGFGQTTVNRNFLKILLDVVKKEKVSGLFKGLTFSLIKASASSSFSFFFYKVACDFLK